MVRISSRWMPFVRRFSVPLWATVSAVSAGFAFVGGRTANDPWDVGFGLVFFVAFGVLLHGFSKDLVDSVHDCGTFLQVQRDEVTEQIPMRQITGVSTSLLARPAKIVLRLSQQSAFGHAVCFLPRVRFFTPPVGTNAIAKELLSRAAVARESGDA